MAVVPILPRVVHSRRGASPPLQAVLILAAALFITLALKQFLTGPAAPVAQAGVDASSRGTASAPVSPAPAAPAGVVTPAMAAANKRLGELRDEIDTAYAAAYVAAGRPGADPDRQAKYDRFLKQLEEKYVAEPIEVPGGGYRGTIFRPRDPGGKAVLALVGTDGGHDGSLQIAAALVRQYGADHLTVVGHALGGGMAGYAGAMLGVRAIGFDSAPLDAGSLETVRRFGVPGAEANVTNVNAEGEVAPSPPGRQVGEAITVAGRSRGWLAFLWCRSIDDIDTTRGLAYQPAPSALSRAVSGGRGRPGGACPRCGSCGRPRRSPAGCRRG